MLNHSRRILLSVGLLLVAVPPLTLGADPLAPNGVACRDNIPPLQPLELDTTFAGDGTVEFPIAGTTPEYSYASKGYIDGAGEVLLFGEVTPGSSSNRRGVLQRLAADGSIGTLTAFAGGAFGCSSPRSFLTALRLQSGDYVAGGYLQTSCGGIPRALNVLEIRSDGIRLDEYDLVPFSNQLAYAQAFAEQADGRVVAAALITQSGFEGTSFDFGVTRFLTDGTVDAGFGTNGTFVFDLDGDQDFARGVVVDEQGRILVTGPGTASGGTRDILVLGLTPDGVLDPAFGNNGVFRYDRAGFSDSPSSLVLTPNRILVAGSTGPDADRAELTVVGLTRDGALDPGFSGDGIATIDIGASVAGLSDITVGPRGRVYATGSAELNGTGFGANDAMVAVLREDGSPDPAFNDGAPKVFTFGGLAADVPSDIELSTDGAQILVTGSTVNAENTERRFAAARLVGLQGGMFCDGLEQE